LNVIFSLDIDRQLNTEYTFVVHDLEEKMKLFGAKLWEFLENPNEETARNLVEAYTVALKCIDVLRAGVDIAFAKGVINEAYNDVNKALDNLELELKEKLIFAITYHIF